MKDFRQANPEFYINNNKETLVITIGDSWTWGDSLGSIPHTDADDLNARQTQAYGRHIADELNADWINCGYCGWGNIRIIRKLYEFVTGENNNIINNMTYYYVREDNWPEFDYKSWEYTKYIKDKIRIFLDSNPNYAFASQPRYTNLVNKYKNVYYYVTLTETGRDTLFYDFFDTNTVNDYLIKEESFTYYYLNHIKEKYNINLTVGRNFTVDFKETSNSMSLKENWVQINYKSNATNNVLYDDISKHGAVSGVAFDHLKNTKEIYKTHTFSDTKEYFVKQIDYIDKLWLWLRNNKLNHNLATCHPTKESHKLWAGYLLKNTE